MGLSRVNIYIKLITNDIFFEFEIYLTFTFWLLDSANMNCLSCVDWEFQIQALVKFGALINVKI